MSGHKSARKVQPSAWEMVNKRVEKDLSGFSRAFALREQMKIEEQKEEDARAKQSASR